MPGMNLTRVEAQERASIVTKVHSYEVKLDLTTSEETFRSETTVKFSATAGASTFIDAITRTVHSVTLNGAELDPAEVSDGIRIQLPDLAEENELKVVADAIYMHSGEGLHRLVDPADDEVYLYTQFEVPDSRRMYAVFEQPDLKSTYQFTVTAPDHWKVISNAPTPEPAPAGDGKAVWEFPATQVMSSYITALVAGPFESVHDELVSSSGRTVPLGLYARKSMFQYLDSDNIFRTTKQGFEFFEAQFKTPYPFEKYDQLFVPDFNAGAMENAGCVTYREDYVFRSKVPDAVVERRGITILHELAHMWFGDLVTMKWWNDLWLNESFAEYMSTLASAENTEWTEAWTTFSIMEKTWAYRQDQLPSTHPIMANIRDLDDIQVNFDGITYAKGASVLKQLVSWVGRDEFMAGVAEYFTKHAWGNTELPDLMSELEAASGRDLGEWSKKWLQTSGVNILRPEIETAEDGTIASFAILQENSELSETLRPHRLAVGFYELEDGQLVRTHREELDIDGERTEVPALAGLKRPALALVNDDDLAYAKIRLDGQSHATALENLGAFAESLPRTLVWGAVWDAVRDGEIPATEFVELLLNNIGSETESTNVMILLRQLATSVHFYVPEQTREKLMPQVASGLWKLAREAEAGSDSQLQFVKAFAHYASTGEHLDVVAGLKDGSVRLEGFEVDTDLNWELLFSLVAGGRAGEAEIDEHAAADKTANGHNNAAYAKAALPTPEAKEKAWADMVDNDDLSNSVMSSIVGGFGRVHDLSLLEPFAARYFEAIAGVWARRSHEMGQMVAIGGYPSQMIDAATVQATEDWLASNPEAPAGLVRLVTENKANVERALKARAAVENSAK